MSLAYFVPMNASLQGCNTGVSGMAKQQLEIRKQAAAASTPDVSAIESRLSEIEGALDSLTCKAKRLDQERQTYRDAVSALRDSVVRSLAALDAVSFHAELGEEISQLRAAQRALMSELRPSSETDESPTVGELTMGSMIQVEAPIPDDDHPTVGDLEEERLDSDQATTVDELRLSEVYKRLGNSSAAVAKGPPRSSAGSACKSQLKALLNASEKLHQTRKMPLSGTVIDLQFIAELYDRSLSVLEEFLIVHDENKRMARRIFDDEPRSCQQAKVAEFWAGQPTEQYRHYRSQAVIDKVFDFIEDQINHFHAFSYYELIDVLAATVNVQRIAPRAGDLFDESVHKTQGVSPAPGCVVKEITSSGYLDLQDSIPARRATVTVDAPRKAAALAPSALVESASREVPPHPEVERCHKRVIGLKLALLKMLNASNTELLEPLPAEVKAMIHLKCNEYHKRFRELHAKHREQAQQRYERLEKGGRADLGMFWDDEVVSEYRRYATMGFMEDVLDPVEDQILAVRKIDALHILDLLAWEMDLVRLPIQFGKTKFDPIVHDGPAANDAGCVVLGLIRSGYDAADGERLYRKATVTL